MTETIWSSVGSRPGTTATSQRNQLSPLPLHLVLCGAKTEQVLEQRLLGITIDSQLPWDSHTDNVCKTVLRRVFLLLKLMYTVDIDTRKLFFSVHIKPAVHIIHQSCGTDVLKKRLNSLLRRVVKLIFPDANLTTEQGKKEIFL